jgi:carbonic anhydrase
MYENEEGPERAQEVSCRCYTCSRSIAASPVRVAKQSTKLCHLRAASITHQYRNLCVTG